MLDFFKETLAISLSEVPPPKAGPGGLPPLVEESLLADYAKQRWILFEHMVVTQDRCGRVS